MVHSKSLIKHRNFVNTVLNMKMKKHQCIANFLIGFGSILNIAPVVTVTPIVPTNGQAESNKLVRASWERVGENLKQARKVGA